MGATHDGFSGEGIVGLRRCFPSRARFRGRFRGRCGAFGREAEDRVEALEGCEGDEERAQGRDGVGDGAAELCCEEREHDDRVDVAVESC